MGGDIAAWCALRGLTVTLQDRGEEYVAPAHGARARVLREAHPGSGQARGRARAPASRTSKATASPRRTSSIEAIFENLEAKRELYARLEPRMKPDCAARDQHLEHRARAAGARSSRDPSAWSACTSSIPSRRCRWSKSCSGARHACQHARRPALAFARQIDKLPLPCRSAPGFLVNRVLMPYLQRSDVRRAGRRAAGAHRPGGRRLRHADGTDRAGRRRRPRCRHERRQDLRRRARPRGADWRSSMRCSSRRSSAGRAAQASTSGRTASR